MSRENFRKTKQKSPKFKDSYDEDFDWQDRVEIQNLRRKPGKRQQKRKDNKSKW